MRLSVGWGSLALALLGLGTPAKSEWLQAHSKHFIIYADEPEAELRTYAERLERFDHAVRTIRRMPDPQLSDAGRVTIYVLPNEGAVQHLHGGSWVYGYYITRVSGSVAFVPRKAGLKTSIWDLDADAVFFHEYSHHLQLQSADVAMPAWVREGFAEFFARTQLRDDGSVVLGVPPAYRSYSLLENNALGIRDMLGAETMLGQAQFEGIYARGWALTHYLTFTPERRGQLDRYIASIQQGVPPLRAAEEAFGNLGDLSSALNGYVRRKKLPHLVMTGMKVPEASISIRQLSPAESAIMRVHIRTMSGGTKNITRDIASDARRIAPNYPNDAFVQTTLAQAEFEAKNFAAADAAADRALAANPNYFGALVAKAKAQLELGRSAGRGNWGQIRKWLLKANKVDQEAAEPLMLFYKSYLYAGEAPTRNAVDGLLYAVALVPQDNELRLTAVRQLVADARFADARKYFGPFAFSPHSEKSWREASSDAVDAIAKADRPRALNRIEQLQKLLEEDD